MSLPRLMTLRDDGTLGIEPVPELEALRLHGRDLSSVAVPADDEVTLEPILGDCMELYLELDVSEAREVGVAVRSSPNDEERTEITVNPERETVRVDLGRSTLDPAVDYGVPLEAASQVAPFSLGDGEAVRLRVFLDRSVLEVFVNGRQCLTNRIYPTRGDSTGVRLFTRGGRTEARIVKAWDMEQVSPW